MLQLGPSSLDLWGGCFPLLWLLSASFGWRWKVNSNNVMLGPKQLKGGEKIPTQMT